MRTFRTTCSGFPLQHVENRMVRDSEWPTIEDEYIALDDDPRCDDVFDWEEVFEDYDDIDEI